MSVNYQQIRRCFGEQRRLTTINQNILYCHSDEIMVMGVNMQNIHKTHRGVFSILFSKDYVAIEKTIILSVFESDPTRTRNSPRTL